MHFYLKVYLFLSCSLLCMFYIVLLLTELILKVKIHGSSDPDYIEIEIPRWKLTYNNLLKICCEELQIVESDVERIRKLPDTRLRKDSDVRRLKEYHSLEVVLKSPISGEKALNCYQSISSCKNQTILYWVCNVFSKICITLIWEALIKVMLQKSI